MSGDDLVESLTLERRGSDYALVKADKYGSKTEIIFSEGSMMFLRKILFLEVRKIAARRLNNVMNTQGVSSVVAFPVSRVGIVPDLHQRDVLMTTIDEFGEEITFALPLEILKSLRDHLPSLIADMESHSVSKIKQ